MGTRSGAEWPSRSPATSGSPRRAASSASPRWISAFRSTWGATPRLIAEIGAARARELILMCDRVDAATAERWGLVHRVVPASRLDADGRRLGAAPGGEARGRGAHDEEPAAGLRPTRRRSATSARPMATSLLAASRSAVARASFRPGAAELREPKQFARLGRPAAARLRSSGPVRSSEEPGGGECAGRGVHVLAPPGTRNWIGSWRASPAEGPSGCS